MSALSSQSPFNALLSGQLGLLAEILRNGADINAVAAFRSPESHSKVLHNGDTLAHLAVKLGNLEALELLLRLGANINVSSVDQLTPFLLAVIHSRDEMALRLLAANADFAAADIYGQTALHYSSSSPILSWILDKRVSVELKAHSTGWTPLHYAAYHHQTQKAQFLLARGANSKTTGNNDETPLHLTCASYGNVRDIVRLLLDDGAAVDALDNRRNTPLHWAVGINHDRNFLDQGNLEAVDCLLSNGANPHAENKTGLSPLDFAWRCRRPEFKASFELRSFRPSLRSRLTSGF
jgi:ankyrin repeat protein